MSTRNICLHNKKEEGEEEEEKIWVTGALNDAIDKIIVSVQLIIRNLSFNQLNHQKF